jgi:hypothetical protein
MTPEEIREAYRRKRPIANRGWLVFFVGFVTFGLGAFSLPLAASSALRVLGMVSFVAGVLLAMGGLLMVTQASRCPACGALPFDQRRRLLLNPARCPSCGVELR